MPVVELIGRDGRGISCIEMKSRTREYERPGRTGCDPRKAGKFIEDYRQFPNEEAEHCG